MLKTTKGNREISLRKRCILDEIDYPLNIYGYNSFVIKDVGIC